MKSISTQTKALIEQLNQPVGFWEKIKGKRNEAELLSRISEAGEAAVIVDIIPFVLSESREVASAAAAAVDKLLSVLSPQELARLDSVFRERSPYLGRYRMEWHKLKPPALIELERLGSHSIALLGLASFHESGYVREEAVKRLGASYTGAELPFLLIRLNDWVRNIHEAAQQAIVSRLSPQHASSFVANLALVTRLEQTERSDNGKLVEAIESLLKRADCREALLRGLESPDRFIRRASFSLAADAAVDNQSLILGRALSDRDTAIRLWAARKIAAEFTGERLDEFLALMKNDRFMPVRREALRAFVKRLPEQAAAELRRALLDTHVSMREEARYHLQKAEKIDFALFYRQALNNTEGRELHPVISGLGETGSGSDDTLLIQYTAHKSTKIRRAAIKALSRLNGAKHSSLFISALQDEMPGVSREAQKALASLGAGVDGELLWETFSITTLPHTRRNVLSLFTRLGKWDSIYFLIKAAGEADDEIAERSRLYIECWLMKFNRSFSTPSREQMARLRGVLGQWGTLLDETMREKLWFSIKGFEHPTDV